MACVGSACPHRHAIQQAIDMDVLS